MTAQIAKTARKKPRQKRSRLSEELARSWFYERGEDAPDRSFDITVRHLANIWGWSIYGVTKLLNSMEAAGCIIRDVLPDNGGTRITIAEMKSESVIVSMIPRGQAVKNDSGAVADFETTQILPSKSLTDKLAQAYHGIIYDEPGFEYCDVVHLEMIEQALFPDVCPSQQLAA